MRGRKGASPLRNGKWEKGSDASDADIFYGEEISADCDVALSGFVFVLLFCESVSEVH